MENSTSGIKFKEKVGYALGDTANLLSFGLISGFLQMFYTDVLYIPLGQITILMIVARIWDAINDPIWGAIIDRRKSTKNGRFRPYLKWLAVPLAISVFLVFAKIPGLSQNQYLIYAYITYIVYGMIYTAINIPYGSLASVITSDELERSDLSVYRSVGSGIGGLPSQILLPLFVYSTAVSTGEKYLDGNKLMIGVAILVGFSVIIYMFSYKMTTERVVSQPKAKENNNLLKTLKVLLKNRAFIVLSLASMFLIATQMYVQTINNYLFKDYFGQPQLYSLVTICTYAPMVLLLPFVKKIVIKFGKKEACAAGMGFSAVAYLLMYFSHLTSPVTYLVYTFFAGLGTTFFVLEVWALVTDVIDYQEFLSGNREEGTSFACYSFTRKLGQTIAGIVGTQILAFIGYDAKNITTHAVSKMYTAATLVPFILCLAMCILLGVLYPLSKKKLKELHDTQYNK